MEFYVLRYKDLETKEFEVEIITPMFLGGANNKFAELRTQSFKGMLRFWWRAIYGENDVEAMKKKEDELFGSTESKSQVCIEIENIDCILSRENEKLPRGELIRVSGGIEVDVIKYLSYGVESSYKIGNKKIKDMRRYLKPGGKFKLLLRYPKSNEEEILNSLWTLVNCSGIGSKSRNGFGCLYVASNQLPKRQVKSFFNEHKRGDLKKFTAFSEKAQLFTLGKSFNSWDKALSEVGKIYFNTRRSLGIYKRSLISKPIIQAHGRTIRSDRHAKPYFLHVNKNSKGEYSAHILFLPYEYRGNLDEYLRACNAMNEKIREELKIKHWR